MQPSCLWGRRSWPRRALTWLHHNQHGRFSLCLFVSLLQLNIGPHEWAPHPTHLGGHRIKLQIPLRLPGIFLFRRMQLCQQHGAMSWPLAPLPYRQHHGSLKSEMQIDPMSIQACWSWGTFSYSDIKNYSKHPSHTICHIDCKAAGWTLHGYQLRLQVGAQSCTEHKTICLRYAMMRYFTCDRF